MDRASNQNGPSRGPLVLGIDTGGTYTDGVLLDYHTRKVVASHKSLTTRRDLSIGIEEVMRQIRIEDPSAVMMTSISTTLATNAIAEGKSKRAALFLIGYDPDLIKSYKMEDRFATPNYDYFAGGHDLYGREQKPLDMHKILDRVNQIKTHIDAIAVSSYFSPLNPDHENRVRKALADACDLPIVLGHHLSTKLGSVERATTAAINASLLPLLQNFVKAVRRAMARRQIKAPLLLVRGDGTLMSEKLAAQKPVETIHSGPAASAIGARFLSRLEDALVVDIGGTTTDIALIQAGQVSVNEAGATVADYKTAVKAAHLLSIPLGGDSHIALDPEKNILVGPERFVPLSYLAWQHPQVQNRLESLSKSGEGASPQWLEFWFLLREPQSGNGPKTKRHQTMVDMLRHGPMPLPQILKRLNLLHVTQLDTGYLFQQEIIAKAGLTPTDLLHVEDRFAPWDTKAASLALDFLCRLHSSTPDHLRQKVWAIMTETIVGAIVSFLNGKAPLQTGKQQAVFGNWHLQNSLYDTHPNLETRIRLRQPLVGIGAPAAIFLKPVAEALHTDLILPVFHEVANAVGAVAGSVMASEEVLVFPRVSPKGYGTTGFYAQTSDGRQLFEGAHEALSYARTFSRDRALEEALRSGADNPQVIMDEQNEGLDTCRVQARAMGNPRLTA